MFPGMSFPTSEQEVKWYYVARPAQHNKMIFCCTSCQDIGMPFPGAVQEVN